MADRIEKFLRSLSASRYRQIMQVLEAVMCGNLTGLDVMKLQGFVDLYRVRKGDMRIIFTKNPDGSTRIIEIERRSDTTYRF